MSEAATVRFFRRRYPGLSWGELAALFPALSPRSVVACCGENPYRVLGGERAQHERRAA